jgi:putative lipoic acid-binding regulatory protein
VRGYFVASDFEATGVPDAAELALLAPLRDKLVTSIAEQFDPTFDAASVELRESTGGKYLGVTITVTATSREQLDDLYRTLTSHPMVKVVL